MDQSTIHFLPVSKLQVYIDKINNLIPHLREQNVSFAEINNQIVEYKSTKWGKSTDVDSGISVSLGLNEKNSVKPMYLEIEGDFRTTNYKLQLNQRYSINMKDCVPNLKYTEVTIIKKINEGELNYSKVQISSDDEVLINTSNTYLVPDQKTDVTFARISAPSEIKAALTAIANPVYLAPPLGFLEYKFNSSEKKTKESAFGQKFVFDNYSMIGMVNGKIVIEGIAALDEGSQVSYFYEKNQKRKNWTTPIAFKDKIFLGQPQLGASYFDSNLTQQDQEKNEYILKANKKLDYDHFRAYYSAEEIGLENEFKIYKLKEAYPPVVSGEPVAADLESNSTIQTDLPEIQRIAESISKMTSDRKVQVVEILKYLSLNYSYDHEMLEKDKVRPLTTKEALDRKKGVCQHYAVIFTAIARALKIPTRIVFGYFIDSTTTTPHAWVETEVSKNLWQVIEPQAADGLERTKTRFYFPISRAKNLEDMNLELVNDVYYRLYNSKYIALPLN